MSETSDSTLVRVESLPLLLPHGVDHRVVDTGVVADDREHPVPNSPSLDALDEVVAKVESGMTSGRSERVRDV